MSFTPVAEEKRFVLTCAERKVVDAADAGLREALCDKARKIEVGPGAFVFSIEEGAACRISGKKRGFELWADLVGTLADAWADRGVDALPA